MVLMRGKQSAELKKPVYITGHACTAGKKEGEGPLGSRMDLIVEDPCFGKDNWEEAESAFLKEAALLAMKKAGKKSEEVRMAFSGDLLRQMTASSFAFRELGIPYYGIFGACSSIGAALSAAAMAVHGGFADTVLAGCSSHFASVEKEFRFPLAYGSQRPYSASWTVTGAGAFIVDSRLSGKEAETSVSGKRTVSAPALRIRGFTTGRVKDYGVSDVFNMGAGMAPAAADTIYQALEDFQMKPEDFDCIATGDLGAVGRDLLLGLLDKNNLDISRVHMDCGMQIYDDEKQDTHAGGSGPACSALVLSSMILPRLESGVWQRVLFVPTGALLSQVSANEGRTIPAIAHALWIEADDQL